MTGENFKRIDRHNSKLESLVSKYNEMADELTSIYDEKIRYGIYTDEEFEYYWKLRTAKYSLANLIWCNAFYEYGRTNEAANEYCKNKGILFAE